MSKENTNPKKHLSQNFLINEGVAQKMADITDLSGKVVVEIGPGKGAITEKILAKNPKKLIALEIDKNLVLGLKEKFSTEIKKELLELREGDALSFNADSIEKDYLLVANIPYHITGLIFRHFLTSKNQPAKMIILMQKEVAERIVSFQKKESILSLSVKAFGAPSIITKVKRGSFYPAPKVESAIILIDNINRLNFKDQNQEKEYFSLIKLSFAQKRKTLLNNLSENKLFFETAEKLLEIKNLPKKIRAEDLDFQFWLDFIHRL